MQREPDKMFGNISSVLFGKKNGQFQNETSIEIFRHGKTWLKPRNWLKWENDYEEFDFSLIKSLDEIMQAFNRHF